MEDQPRSTRPLTGAALTRLLSLPLQLQLPDILLVLGAAEGLFIHEQVIVVDKRDLDVANFGCSFCCEYLSEPRQTRYCGEEIKGIFRAFKSEKRPLRIWSLLCPKATYIFVESFQGIQQFEIIFIIGTIPEVEIIDHGVLAGGVL
jgi:hypothetical protein